MRELCHNTLTPARTLRLHYNAVMLCIVVWELCHNTLTPARTLRLHYNAVMRCIVMWRLSSAMISSCITAPISTNRDQSFPKTVCGCLCGGVISYQNNKKSKQRPLTRNPLTPWNAFFNVHLNIAVCACVCVRACVCVFKDRCVSRHKQAIALAPKFNKRQTAA